MPICGPLAEQIDSLPITPPDLTASFDDKTFKPDSKTIKKALHVLATEREALSHLEQLYTDSPVIQDSLLRAISQILNSETRHGKTIFTGVGKSGHIAKKLVATFVSLGIHAIFLHPVEALHGDLGVVRPVDTVIMITFSGRTPELLSLIPHIQPCIPLIVMTAHMTPTTCPLLSHPSRQAANNTLLPTILHESEVSSFGVSAPTTSTTITLALGDSLALAVADEMHLAAGLETLAVFKSNHPGGAIGAALNAQIQNVPTMADLATNISQIPMALPHTGQPLMCLNVLLAAVKSAKGFVRISPAYMIGPRRVQQLHDPTALVEDFEDELGRVVVERTDWISVLSTSTVEECRQWIRQMRDEGSGRGRYFLKRGTLLGIVEHNEVTGIVEIEDVMGDDFD
jgi:D-arabinose 5-phosphate isomerase GutQ